jgi:protein TilB
MPRLTHELIRKKSEHNDGIMADLEEISLHQLEIEKIEAINDCRKLKILYLQNNIINRIENLFHLKDLEYLNLALNNVKRIEGLRNCEFLKKLDLTVNFIGIENLESSVEELKHNHNLAEIYLLGNPCVDWKGCQDFVIGSLPSLKRLDGTQITKTMQIQAAQRLPMLTHQLRLEVAAKKREKAQQAACGVEVVDVDISEQDGAKYDEEGNELTAHTPEARTAMYREMGEEKEEKEKEQNKNKPPTRRYDEEHREAVAAARAAEETGRIMQCNTGGFKFTLDETKADVIVDIFLPKNLDTSLVDVHAQPTYVCVVVKTKVLRLKFDVEVRPDSGTAKRSKVTGNLLLTFPKIEQGKYLTPMQLHGGTVVGQSSTAPPAGSDGSRATGGSGKNARAAAARNEAASGRTRYFTKGSGGAGDSGGDGGGAGGAGGAGSTNKKMAEMMQEASKAVSVRGIAKNAPDDSEAPVLSARSTVRLPAASARDDDDDDDDDDAPLPPSQVTTQAATAAPPSTTARRESDEKEEENEEEEDDDDEEPPPLDD